MGPFGVLSPMLILDEYVTLADPTDQGQSIFVD